MREKEKNDFNFLWCPLCRHFFLVDTVVNSSSTEELDVVNWGLRL